MNAFRWSSVVCLAACNLQDPGPGAIAVGNPPTTQVRISVADGDGVSFSSFSVALSGVYLETCDNVATVEEWDVPITIGLRDSVLDVTAGEYCAIGLIPVGDAELEGAAGLGTFRFTGGLSRIFVYGDGVRLEETGSYVLELAEPGWIADTAFGLADGQFADFSTEACLNDSVCALLVQGLTDRSALFEDTDGDGEVSGEERDAGADAAGDQRRDDRI